MDDASAFTFRRYLVLNPNDFQVWLDRYASYIQLLENYSFQPLYEEDAHLRRKLKAARARRVATCSKTSGWRS